MNTTKILKKTQKFYFLVSGKEELKVNSSYGVVYMVVYKRLQKKPIPMFLFRGSTEHFMGTHFVSQIVRTSGNLVIWRIFWNKQPPKMAKPRNKK